jgi:hypothetical protein
MEHSLAGQIKEPQLLGGKYQIGLVVSSVASSVMAEMKAEDDKRLGWRLMPKGAASSSVTGQAVCVLFLWRLKGRLERSGTKNG